MASSNTILPPGVTSDAGFMTTGSSPSTSICYVIGPTRMFHSGMFSAIVTFKDPNRRKEDVMAAMRGLAVDESTSFSDLKFTIADVNAALSYFSEEDITKVKRRIQGLDWVR